MPLFTTINALRSIGSHSTLPEIPALGNLRQEEYKFKASLNYIEVV